MKKTEKIELRVDHAEKERLAAIAEQRGQTVSDVVREALADDLGVMRMRPPRWPGIAAVTAGLLAIVAMGLTLSNLDQAPAVMAKQTIYPDTISLNVQTNTEAVSFDLPVETQSRKSLHFNLTDQRLYRLEIATDVNADNDLLTVHASGCIEVDGACEAGPIQSVSIDTRPHRYSRADMTATLAEREYLQINVRAETFSSLPSAVKANADR